MKKISLYMFSLLVLAGFSACDEDYTDWANPQSNPQEESKSGITAQVAGVTSEVVMDTYAEDSVVIAKLESLSGSDEIVGYKLQLAGNDKTLDIPFAEKDGALKVDAAELELLTMQLYNSRQAVARDIAVKVGVSAMASDNQAVSVDVADINMKVTPVTLLRWKMSIMLWEISLRGIWPELWLLHVMRTMMPSLRWSLQTKRKTRLISKYSRNQELPEALIGTRHWAQ